MPASSATTELDFDSGTATYTSTDNISGAFQLNILTLAMGTGTATATIAALTNSSLDFVANGTTAPVLNMNNGGQFTFNTTVPITLDGALTLKGSGAGTVYIQALISGGGSLTKSSTGSGQLTLTNGNNSYSGGTTLTAGTISVQASGALGSGSVLLGGGKLSLYNTQTQTNNISVTANSTLEAAINTGGATSQAMTVNGNVSVASGVILSLTNTGNATINSLGTISTAITGSGSVLKGGVAQGTGWLLSGNNTYSGTTSVTSTTLAITGTTSGQGNYTVTNNATNGTAGTLAGNGTIGLTAGNSLAVTGLSAAVQATVSPSVPTSTTLNSGVGTLSVVWSGTSNSNKVTFGNYSTLSIDVGASGSSDRLVVGTTAIPGALTLGGTNSTLALTSGTGAFDGSTYIIAKYTGALTGTFPVLTVDGTTETSATSFTANGFMYNVVYGVTDPNGGFDIDLTPTTVPEPATWASALMLLGFTFAHRRGRSLVQALIAHRA